MAGEEPCLTFYISTKGKRSRIRERAAGTARPGVIPLASAPYFLQPSERLGQMPPPYPWAGALPTGFRV